MVRVLHGVNVAPALVNFLKNEVRRLPLVGMACHRLSIEGLNSIRTSHSSA